MVKYPQPKGVQTYTRQLPNYSGLEYSKEQNIRLGSDEKAKSWRQSKEILIGKDNRDANSTEFKAQRLWKDEDHWYPIHISLMFSYFLLLKSEGSWYADISESCWFSAQAAVFPLQMCCNLTCKLLMMQLCYAITIMLMQNFVCLYSYLLMQHTYGPKSNFKKISLASLIYSMNCRLSQLKLLQGVQRCLDSQFHHSGLVIKILR